MDEETDFLDGMIEPSEATATPPEPEVTEPQAEPAERDDKGRFAKKGEDEGAPPAPKEPAFEGAATLAERQRRQAAEQRAATLEQQLQAYQNPPPSVFEDEVAYGQNIQTEAVAKAVAEATYQSHLNMSEMMVRQAHPDFDQAKADFLALADTNPGLVQQALQDPHPWNKAYQIAKNHKAMQDLGASSVAELEAKIEQRIRAEMGTALPQSLADSQSARGGANAAPGPMTLKELLG